MAYLTDDQSTKNIWKIGAGLTGDADTYSFASVADPDHFLVMNGNQQATVQKITEDQKKYATFKRIAGIAGLGGLTIENVGYPGYYLKHDLTTAKSGK